MFTPRDELERVPSFDRQCLESEAQRQAEFAPVFCDSCGDAVDQATEPGRYRHAGCPTPPLPPAAVAVMQRVRTRQTETDRVDA